MNPTRALAWLALAAFSAASLAADVANRVVFELGSLVVDHGKGIAEITQAQAKGGFRAVHDSAHNTDIGLGLYQNRMTTTLEATTGQGKNLALVTRIKTEPIIYIAKEFTADSCAYKVVLAHERQHYLYDRDVLRTLPREVRNITWATFANPVPSSQAQVERGKQVFFQQFNHAYESLSFPLHSRIDNPASYAALAELCGGEIKKVVAGKS